MMFTMRPFLLNACIDDNQVQVQRLNRACYSCVRVIVIGIERFVFEFFRYYRREYAVLVEVIESILSCGS